MGTERSEALIERDNKVIAPSQHRSYSPLLLLLLAMSCSLSTVAAAEVPVTDRIEATVEKKSGKLQGASCRAACSFAPFLRCHRCPSLLTYIRVRSAARQPGALN